MNKCERDVTASLFNSTWNTFTFISQTLHCPWVNMKWLYLLLYSIALKTVSLLTLKCFPELYPLQELFDEFWRRNL